MYGLVQNNKKKCTFAIDIYWKVARVVEWVGLENRCTLTGTQGSNP